MILCPLSRVVRATAPEPRNGLFAPRNRTGRSGRLCPAAQRHSVSDTSGKLPKLLGVVRRVGATLIVLGLAVSARGQSSVTLAWDPSPDSAIAGYRLYEGVASQTYSNVIDVGNATTVTVSNLVSGVTYFFAVSAYDTNGQESELSAEVSYTVSGPLNNVPTIALTSPADGAVYAAPATINLTASVTANGHTITQVQFYSGATLLGAVASARDSFAWNNVSAGTYSLSAKAVYDSDSTVDSPVANVTVAAGQPPSGLTFAADSGIISAPFFATNGSILQSLKTGVTDGGRAAYSFNVVNAGIYLVSAMVGALDGGQSSLYVNIDAEPTDPLMIWDIPASSAVTSQTVSWRGNGNGDPASSQYLPKVFTLSAGDHQLIIRGRQANVGLGTISITAAPPTLQVRSVPGGHVILSGTGQAGQMYNILCSGDLQTWTLIGTLTLDESGSGQFTDSAATSHPLRFYRLRGQ
jgi:Bacterial Ig domain/Fibronectin type III domain